MKEARVRVEAMPSLLLLFSYVKIEPLSPGRSRKGEVVFESFWGGLLFSEIDGSSLEMGRLSSKSGCTNIQMCSANWRRFLRAAGQPHSC